MRTDDDRRSRISRPSISPRRRPPGERRRGRTLAHARRHRGEARLRPGRPRRPRFPRHLSGPARPFCAAPIPPCTSPSRGRSGNMPASPRRKIPTPSTGATSRPGRRAFRSPSISPPTAATTATIRASPATSAWRASRSISIYDMRTLFDRHPARPDVGVDDHERRGAAGARALHRRRRGAGRAAGEARRHDPERHPQRIHGAQHLHLSARAVAAHHLRHLRLHRGAHAEVQLDLDLRLSHAGGGRDATSSSPIRSPTASNMCAPGSPPGSRSTVCAAAVVLLERPA